MNSLLAVIDMGTNTFHLLIAEPNQHAFHPIHQESLVMRIGQGGISQGLLTESAYQRTLDGLAHFRSKIDQHGVELQRVFATATSAIRSAKNGPALVAEIESKTGIRVQVINGEKEAEYIYYGVRAALPLGETPSLIMDIGGGSVEFIIGYENGIQWKQSFEIGAQRLLDRFMAVDPIPAASISDLYQYLDEKLAPLQEAIRLHQPQTLVGSLGSFDTLAEIHYRRTGQDYDEQKYTEFTLPIASFRELHRQITTLDRHGRKQMEGMAEMRVDMIVMASCLIDYVLNRYGLTRTPIRVSSYALKEGVMQSLLQTD